MGAGDFSRRNSAEQWAWGSGRDWHRSKLAVKRRNPGVCGGSAYPLAVSVWRWRARGPGKGCWHKETAGWESEGGRPVLRLRLKTLEGRYWMGAKSWEGGDRRETAVSLRVRYFPTSRHRCA